MKSLKKTLALVLVCAMVFGLMGVASASSSSFTDTAKTQYGEAINVLTGTGVIAGTTATTFEPTSSLTREQAAKIITYLMLGSTNAALLSGATTTTYSDVASSRWSAGYIQYCTNTGILVGNGDGTFNPTGALTSCAWSKMLLCALGYKADLEGFTGASWAINVAAKAVVAGINDSTIALSSTTSINREQACQMAFKTLTATEVYYDSTGTTVSSGDIKIVTGATAAKAVAKTGSLNYNNSSDTDKDTTQFCEGHFPTLLLSSTALTNAFGRPADTWTFGASRTVIAQAASTAALTYTTSFYPNTAYKALVNGGYALPTANAAGTINVPVYVNGNLSSTYTTVATLNSYFASTATDPLSGNGVSYEFYANSNNILTSIVVINSYIGKVTAYKADDTTTSTVDERSLTMAVPGVGTVTAYAAANTNTSASNPAATGFDAVYATAVAALTAGVDVSLMVVPQKDTTTGAYTGNALNVTLPTTASGAFTAFSTGSNLTIGGTVYKYGKNNAIDTGLLTSGNVTAGVNVTVVLDAYGYAVGLKATTTASNYAYVLNTTSVTNSAFTNQAQLLLNDGTVVVANLTSDPGTTLVGTVVTYSVNTAGAYTLTSFTTVPSTQTYPASVPSTVATDLAITTGASAITVPVTGAASNTTIYANANTIFLVATYNTSTSSYTYAAYKGIANVPSLKGVTEVRTSGVVTTKGTRVAYGMDSSTANLADVVFVTDAASAGVVSTTGTYIFDNGSALATDSTGTYYTYNAVVNGTVTTVKVSSAVVASNGTATVNSLGLYGNLLSSVTYTNGIITTVRDYSNLAQATYGAGLTGSGLTMATNGVVGLTGKGLYGYTSTALVFYVTKNADGSFTIAPSTIAAVSTDSNDDYCAVLNTSGVITALYVYSK